MSAPIENKWILLKFYNQYEQYGGYFSGYFDSEEKAAKAAGHLGRKGVENEWYEAVQVSKNEFFDCEGENL